MKTSASLRAGRRAFERSAWAEAYGQLSAARHAGEFASDDLERLAIAAYLTGHDDASADAWASAHRNWLQRADIPRAVRCAFWLAMQLLSARELARAGGWIATAQRLLSGWSDECAEEGLLLVLESRGHLRDGNLPAAQAAAGRAAHLADRCSDPDLAVFGRLAQGLTLAGRGELTAAAGLFDEVMIAVAAADVSPIAAGTAYCAVIESCYEMADVGRAREWTAALTDWCRAHPDLVAFRGHCLVHRAQTLRLSGDWPGALTEVTHVCGPVPPIAEADGGASWRGAPIGAAFYEMAEIYRTRGDYARAEAAYRDASRYGRTPEPGLALLRLAQRRRQEAQASIRRAAGESMRRLTRAGVLAASVEIMIASGDVRAARSSADELAQLAVDAPTPFLRARSAQALGAVLLAERDARSALTPLRDAWVGWQGMEMPYEAAQVRVLMALACRALDDHEAASMELDAARRVFVRLGAAPDAARIDEMLGSRLSSGLTSRELDVIRLLARGDTNRAIARTLDISERTVDRHVANIFTKLDLSSRAAATAYAYEHGLV
jgi:DNA-binding CsgD family transcriptional regulator